MGRAAAHSERRLFLRYRFERVRHSDRRHSKYRLLAVATLQIPIFSWGSDRSKLKQAELRRDQAHVELNYAQKQLLSHLRQFYLEAKTSRSEMESLASSAELAADSMRLTTLRYQAGESTVLEVVDAQNTLTQARNAYDDGQSRYRVAVANLQTLTGTF